ncbi:MAG: hypothetical protein AAF492_11570, partial [Verrucomicrobiota bacterium]
TDRGAVYILFMSTNGMVLTSQKISSTNGNFNGTLADRDNFGQSVAGIGDLDDDGVPDIAVGATGDNGAGGVDQGAVWILFLNANGTVKDVQKINSAEGNLSATLDNQDFFGTSVAGVGDLNDDGVEDIAVGANGDDDGPNGAINRGAVYILFLNDAGEVEEEQKISAAAGGLNGPLADRDQFGDSVVGLPDLNGDGISDLAVGASRDDSGGTNRGAAYILFLDEDGTVQAERKIAQGLGGLGDVLKDQDFFGISVADLGDIDGDGVSDIGVGAGGDDADEVNQGTMYVLFMQPDGTVKSVVENSSAGPLFGGDTEENDFFGTSLAGIGDLNGDGQNDAIVGAPGDNSGDEDAGAVYVLFLEGSVTQAPPPVADAGSNQAACVGSTVTIGGNPTASGGNGGPYVISWHPTTGLSDPSASNPVVSVTNSIVYQVTVTEPATGESASDNVTVTANPLPIADAGKDQDILITEAVVLGGNPTATGAPPFTFDWSPPGDLDNATTSNPTATPRNSTTVEVTVTDANGCVSKDHVTIVVFGIAEELERIIGTLDELAENQSKKACAREIRRAKRKVHLALKLYTKRPPKTRAALNQMRLSIKILRRVLRGDRCADQDEVKAVIWEIVRVGKAIIKQGLARAIERGAPAERITHIMGVLERLKELLDAEKYDEAMKLCERELGDAGGDPEGDN